jgi:hypothetical protein
MIEILTPIVITLKPCPDTAEGEVLYQWLVANLPENEGVSREWSNHLFYYPSSFMLSVYRWGFLRPGVDWIKADGRIFLFRYEEDAMLFKLVWG